MNNQESHDRHFFFRQEVIISVIIFFVSSLYFFSYVMTMGTTSLWNDELYSIMNFSSKGVMVAATDYHVPNNHIFFNIVNSLSPFSDLFTPWKARLFSTLSVLASIILMLIFFIRKRFIFEAVLACLLIMVQPNQLDLLLQARGYSFIALFSVVCFISLHQYLKYSRRRDLIILCMSTILGTWTVPTFIIFSGLVMLFLFYIKRCKITFGAGVVTIIVILFLHIPVIQEMYECSKTYAGSWGTQYSNPGAVINTIKIYMLPFCNNSLVFLFCNLIFILPLCVPKALISDKIKVENYLTADRVMIISAILFFSICIYLGTPVQRTVSFITIPLGLSFINSIGTIIRKLNTNRLSFIFRIILSVFLVPAILIMFMNFNFMPIENWEKTADCVKLITPDNIDVHCNFRSHLLKPYLKKCRLVEKLKVEQLAKGKVVFVDSNFTRRYSYNFVKVSNKIICLKVPQRRGGGQYIYLSPPLENNITGIISSSGTRKASWTDRVPSTGSIEQMDNISGSSNFQVCLKLKPGKKYKSLVVYSGNIEFPEYLNVEILSHDDTFKLPTAAIIKYGRLAIIKLNDIGAEKVILTFFNLKTDQTISINEMWAVSTQ